MLRKPHTFVFLFIIVTIDNVNSVSIVSEKDIGSSSQRNFKIKDVTFTNKSFLLSESSTKEFIKEDFFSYFLREPVIDPTTELYNHNISSFAGDNDDGDNTTEKKPVESETTEKEMESTTLRQSKIRDVTFTTKSSLLSESSTEGLIKEEFKTPYDFFSYFLREPVIDPTTELYNHNISSSSGDDDDGDNTRTVKTKTTGKDIKKDFDPDDFDLGGDYQDNSGQDNYQDYDQVQDNGQGNNQDNDRDNDRNNDQDYDRDNDQVNAIDNDKENDGNEAEKNDGTEMQSFSRHRPRHFQSNGYRYGQRSGQRNHRYPDIHYQRNRYYQRFRDLHYYPSRDRHYQRFRNRDYQRSLDKHYQSFRNRDYQRSRDRHYQRYRPDTPWRSYLKLPTGVTKYIKNHVTLMRSFKCGSKSILLDLKPRDYEYKLMANQMQSTIQNHSSLRFSKYNIRKIEKVVNGCIMRRYKRRQQQILSEYNNLNELLLFHGTYNVKELLANGFDERHASMNGMFGAGMYFAEHSSKSNQYAFGHGGQCDKHKDRHCKICERQMLICRVTLGNIYKVRHARQKIANPPPGYHSLEGVASNTTKGLKYNEYIVYRGEQAYPEYVITYKLKL